MRDLQITPLITEDQIKKRINEMGTKLTDRFKSEPVVAICILKGSLMFFSDLIREMKTDLVCEFMGLSSYHNSSISSGEVKMTLDINTSVAGKHVLIVEDIVDSGLTMNFLQQILKARKPKSVTTVALLHKPDAQKEACELDMVGFKIPNDFVVGYGLDYQGLYRNLPFIGLVGNLN